MYRAAAMFGTEEVFGRPFRIRACKPRAAPLYPPAMEPVRIACVRYLNTAPLIEGLDRAEGVTLLPAVPSRIADLVATGEADIGLVSVVDAASMPLAVVPCGMIGSDGPTLTVRLFSTVPIDRITRLHTDSESHTSVILARVLLAMLHGARPEVIEFDACGANGQWPESVLLIGDKVVTGPPPADRYPYQMDLGEAWKNWTGLPFVYAVWSCCEKDAASQRIRSAAVLLDRQLRHNQTRLEWIVANRAAAAGWPAEVARRYLGDLLRYRVRPQERRAIERFLTLARELELLAPRNVIWAWQP